MGRKVGKKGFALSILLLALALLISLGSVQGQGAPDLGSDKLGLERVTAYPVNSGVDFQPRIGSRLPDAANLTGDNFPGRVDIVTRRNAGSQLMTGLEAIEITELTIDVTGMVPATMAVLNLSQDPTNGDPFDNLNDGTTFFTVVSIPADAVRLVAETFESTAPDINLFVGTGAIPSAATQVCASTTDTAVEYCNIDAPTAGDWWILAQNRAESAAPPDAVTLAYAVVANVCLDDDSIDDDVDDDSDPDSPDGDHDDDDDNDDDDDGDDGHCDDYDDDHDDDFCDDHDDDHDDDHADDHCDDLLPNMWVEGQGSVPAQTPFDLRVFWDEPAMAAGDLWYGTFSVGSDPANPGNVGLVNVDLDRQADDVTKTVSSATAVPGDILTYTISILPNVTLEDLTYTLTDTIPAGMTYIPGSATSSGGVLNVVDDTLTWTGVMTVASSTYVMATSDSDPTCVSPLANSGAYLDLAAFGIPPDPNIFGDSVWYFVDFDGGAFDFFGSPQGEIINFTDDGFVFFDPSTPGAVPWVNEPIPTAGDPNNLLAILWRDMEIVYDAALNRGVSLANLTSDGVPVAIVIEFDDLEEYPAGSGLPTYDIELIAYYDADPGRYEYIFAYDNITGVDGVGTIGLENADGSAGVQYAFNDVALTDGTAICFDLTGTPGSDMVEITYQVTVDADAAGTLSNNVIHNTDNPGSQEASASVDVVLPPKLYVSSNSGGAAGGVTYHDEDIMAYNTNTGVWSLYFDGTDVGLKSTDVDAVHVLDDGSILMSFEQRIKVPGLGKVDDSDIVKFIPTSLGEETAGSFEMFFDGSDVGLKKAGEDVDAIGFTPDGRLVVSTLAAFKVPQTGGDQMNGADDDLIAFTGTVGHSTEGKWELYFDGSDVWHHTEDIWGVWPDAVTGDIYLSLQNEATIGDMVCDEFDIFICHPVSLGADTVCTFELFFDGSKQGFGGDRIDGFSIKK